ncbi:coiled-coil domain-containing protein 33 isoform X2 [Chrysemys picta bellii]|uniref:coiled-coil domain-containing protein 33 isoform X2 n=1 Tax=Chrysemys picta bellii TaxID=8478 RepID=UPI0032B14D54
MNLFARKDEDLYRYSDIMALLRVGEDELAMHCGRLAYAVSFHENRLPVRKETPVSSHQLSPWLSAKEDGEQDGVYTQRVPFPVPLQSLDGPHHSYPRSTPEALTSSAYHSPPIEPRTLSAEQVTVLPGEPDQRAFPELRNDSADEVRSSFSPPSSLAVPRQWLSSASFHLSSPGHSPELGAQDPFTGVQVLEAPSGMDEAVQTSETNHWHLAHSGKESISVTLHGASNLPATQKGNVPWPYVTVVQLLIGRLGRLTHSHWPPAVRALPCSPLPLSAALCNTQTNPPGSVFCKHVEPECKSSSDVEKKWEAQGVTHVSSEPTHSPTWEEKVTMEIDAEDAGHEAVILTVADKITKDVLVSYKIPVRYLRSFHHYHLRLVLPRKKDPLGTSLYATLVRKGSLIPRYVGMNYTGLEVFLQGMKNPLADPQGPIVAIARVVNNFNAYRKAMKMRPSASPAIDLTTITFPDPSMVAFDVLRVTNQGYPQVTQPGGPPEKPTWNSSFLFQGRDGATLFSDDTSLVIEYYPYKTMSETEAENKPKPLGYSVLPLTNRVYRSLVAESNRSGVRVDDVPIQGTNLRTTSGAVPTVQLCMQLIGSERPDMFLTPSNTDTLPILDPKLLGKIGAIREPWAQSSSLVPYASVKGDKSKLALQPPDEMAPIELERKKSHVNLLLLNQDNDVSLPPPEAVAEILPDKQMLLYEKAATPADGDVDDVDMLRRTQDVTRFHLDQELDNYRTAMKKMADDIQSLRRHVASLEAENSTLRCNLSMHEEVGRTLLNDVDVDVMTKVEIVDRIVALKHKLAAGTVEMSRMKDRVQQLQNELIRKNDREKDLVMLQRAHQQQQTVLRKYHEKITKMKALEDTVRQQERVIEKMERMLEEKVPEATRTCEQLLADSFSKEFYSTLLAENMRLREELGRAHYRSSPIILQQQALPDIFSTNSEKLSLLAKVEKAQGRIRALESQLEESARKWGREKQDLSTQLLEQEHGFGRPSSTILHDFSLKTSPDPTTHIKRHQTLDPLP